jgi:hypothetical protein
MSKELNVMMRIVRVIGISCATAVLIGFANTSAVDAKVASCDDIAAAQGRGLSSADIRKELNTTAARVEVCARLAEQDAQQAERKSAARARRNARMGAPEPR